MKSSFNRALAHSFVFAGLMFQSALLMAAPKFDPYISIHVGSSPEAVAIGDVNHDGRNDVVVTTSYNFEPDNDFKLFVFLQDPTGHLLPPVKYATGGTYTNRPLTVDIGDVDGDGLNDVVVGLNGNGVQVFHQTAAGGLVPSAPIAGVNAYKLRIGDLNGDGRLDVAAIGWGQQYVSVLTQDSAGQLSLTATYLAPHGGYDDIEVGDVSGDGLDDIVVMSGQTYAIDNLAVLVQLPTGGFEPYRSYDLGTTDLTQGVGIGDVNGDGVADLVVSYGGNRPASKIGVFLHNALGGFDAPFSLSSYDIPTPVIVADVDGDGRDDVLVVHSGWNQMGVYPQSSTGTLGSEVLFAAPYTSYNPHGFAIGDVDGDGQPDAAIAGAWGDLAILHNASVRPVDLGISKTAPASVFAGEALLYRITVTNLGPNDSSGAEVADTLPAGLALGSVTPSQGSCAVDTGTVSCKLGAIANSGTATIEVRTKAVRAGQVINTASVIASNPVEADPKADNNASSVTTLVEPRPVSIGAKGFISAAPLAGTVTINPQATLTDARASNPVAGKTIHFMANKQFLCDGVTGPDGLAKCNATVVGHLQGAIVDGFAAIFDGDDVYAAGRAQGSLACIGANCAVGL